MKKPTIIAGFLAAVSITALAMQHTAFALELQSSFNIGDISVTKNYQEKQDIKTDEGEVLAATTEVASQPQPEVAPERQPVIVTVNKGDSLSKIASAHNTNYKRLFDANASIADPNVINPGDTIRVPFEDEVIPARELPAAKPVAAPAPTKSAKPAPPKQPSAAAVRMVDDGSVWYQLALCESGGRANAVSPNGKYHGLYQFLPSTWRAMGGSGLPSQASPEEQTMRAKMLQARSGWGQWPACTAKLGLR